MQRRNQKVVEESPSCLLTPATRQQMQMQVTSTWSDTIVTSKISTTEYLLAGLLSVLGDTAMQSHWLPLSRHSGDARRRSPELLFLGNEYETA